MCANSLRCLLSPLIGMSRHASTCQCVPSYAWACQGVHARMCACANARICQRLGMTVSVHLHGCTRTRACGCPRTRGDARCGEDLLTLPALSCAFSSRRLGGPTRAPHPVSKGEPGGSGFRLEPTLGSEGLVSPSHGEFPDFSTRDS